jgi:curved DNA-binding protein CbpA
VIGRVAAERLDHYAVLDVPSTASVDEITRAYHRLVRRLHPDARPDDAEPEHLRAVLAAYAVLRDPARRAAYDRRRRSPTPTRAPSPPPTPPRRTWTPPPQPFVRQQPMIRVGPVRYHGPARP